MPNPFHYRQVLHNLARLASAPNPPHVQVQAAGALAQELSPANPRRDLIQLLLSEANSIEFARHKLRDLYDRAVPVASVESRQDGAVLLTEEEHPEQDDDPL